MVRASAAKPDDHNHYDGGDDGHDHGNSDHNHNHDDDVDENGDVDEHDHMDLLYVYEQRQGKAKKTVYSKIFTGVLRHKEIFEDFQILSFPHIKYVQWTLFIVPSVLSLSKIVQSAKRLHTTIFLKKCHVAIVLLS